MRIAGLYPLQPHFRAHLGLGEGCVMSPPVWRLPPIPPKDRTPTVDLLLVTVRSCRYFGPEVAASRRSVRPVPDRACGSASVRANRVAMRFQCPTPFLTLAITPLRSASIAIWQALRTAPYRHDQTVTVAVHHRVPAPHHYHLDRTGPATATTRPSPRVAGGGRWRAGASSGWGW